MLKLNLVVALICVVIGGAACVAPPPPRSQVARAPSVVGTPQAVPPVDVHDVDIRLKLKSPIGAGTCLLLERGFPIEIRVETPPELVGPEGALVGFTLLSKGKQPGSVLFRDEGDSTTFELAPGQPHEVSIAIGVKDTYGASAVINFEKFPLFIYVGESAEKPNEFCVRLPDQFLPTPEPGLPL